MITLQFVSDTGLAADVIQWYTRSVWNHVDIVMPDHTLTGARAEGGVQNRPANYRRFARVKRFQTALSVEAEKEFYLCLAEQIGKPYDWTGIINFVVDRDWRNPDHWFCSELVAWLFEKAGRPLLRVDSADKVTPRDLTTSFLITPLTQN